MVLHVAHISRIQRRSSQTAGGGGLRGQLKGALSYVWWNWMLQAHNLPAECIPVPLGVI